MITLRQLLSPRQFEIAGLVRYGLSNPEIAKLLGVCEATVHASLIRSFARAGCDNRTMLAVRYALENQTQEAQPGEKKPNQRAA